ncbi:MAG: hypothetical protein JSR54_13165, partial [Proteobacteria bacterium]|nr:hypothetical protein [Pseudomonadota bacterium]
MRIAQLAVASVLTLAGAAALAQTPPPASPGATGEVHRDNADIRRDTKDIRQDRRHDVVKR